MGAEKGKNQSLNGDNLLEILSIILYFLIILTTSKFYSFICIPPFEL